MSQKYRSDATAEQRRQRVADLSVWEKIYLTPRRQDRKGEIEHLPKMFASLRLGVSQKYRSDATAEQRRQRVADLSVWEKIYLTPRRQDRKGEIEHLPKMFASLRLGVRQKYKSDVTAEQRRHRVADLSVWEKIHLTPRRQDREGEIEHLPKIFASWRLGVRPQVRVLPMLADEFK